MEPTTFEIDMAQEDVDMVERAYYEYQGLLTLAAQLAKPEWSDEEAYDRVLKQYLMAFAEFQMTFDRMVYKYTEGRIKGKPEINFVLGKLVITPMACGRCAE